MPLKNDKRTKGAIPAWSVVLAALATGIARQVETMPLKNDKRTKGASYCMGCVLAALAGLAFLSQLA